MCLSSGNWQSNDGTRSKQHRSIGDQAARGRPRRRIYRRHLGSHRTGNGVVIEAGGLVLTIGYLMTEATDVWLTGAEGREVAAHPLAYDQVTGFGLVLPLQKLDVAPIPIGSSAELHPGSKVYVVSARDFAAPQTAHVLARREFAGAWEYLLEDAIFAAPAHPHWSGAALIDHSGASGGIGILVGA